MNNDVETETDVALWGHFKWRAEKLRTWAQGQTARWESCLCLTSAVQLVNLRVPP